jgi:hypothetical protein
MHSATNLAAFWEHPVRAMDQRWQRWDDLWVADPQSPSPIPNSATLLRALDATTAGDVLDRASRFYDAARGAPWMLWSA